MYVMLYVMWTRWVDVCMYVCNVICNVDKKELYVFFFDSFSFFSFHLS